MVRRLVLPLAAFFLVFVVLDYYLYSRLKETISFVDAQMQNSKDGVVKINDIEADECNALTGRLFFKFLLKRSATFSDHITYNVVSATGRCTRGMKHLMIFTKKPQ